MGECSKVGELVSKTDWIGSIPIACADYGHVGKYLPSGAKASCSGWGAAEYINKRR